MPLWDDVRGSIVDWYTVAAERTEELARLGVRHYDRYGLHRRIERLFTELGGHTHRLLVEEQVTDVAQDPKVQELLDTIAGLEEELRAKEEEIAAMRRNPSDRAEDAAETAGAASDGEV